MGVDYSVKRKKTRLAHFADGGTANASAPAATQTMSMWGRVKEALTPEVVKRIREHNERTANAADEATKPMRTAGDVEEVPNKRRGGLIKPRGVGIARKGHGKGAMR